jgi:cell wall-associated NlpC family hydrolase
MGRLILAILCLFVATGMVLATQPKAQKRQSISHKKAKVKSKSVSLREIASRYGDGPTFEGDPDAIRLSSLLFYGTPYRFGGNSSHALDCSGFVQKVFRANGIELLFKTYKQDVSHVGIYIGDGKMVHAATRGGQVMISSIHEPYYR